MDWIVNRVATEKDLKPLYKKGFFDRNEIKGAWVVNDSTIVVQVNFPSGADLEGQAYNKQHTYIGGWDFKGPLGKAIKHFELTSGLKGSAKDTWSDILNFESLVLEEMKEHVYKVIRKANEDELKVLNKQMGANLKKPIDKAWLMDLINKTSLVAPNYTEIGGWEYIVFTPKGFFKSYTSPQSKIISNSSANSTLIDKAVEQWELLHGLKGSATDTWEDILS
jgi:hypothetical protein